MVYPVPFLDRKHELDSIARLIESGEGRCIIGIDAPGGFGKTRLLEEIHQRYTQPGNATAPLLVTDIIDFDDRAFQIPQLVGSTLAAMLDIKAFDPYLQGLAEIRSMEVAGFSGETLQEQRQAVEQTFVECFNSISARRRVMVLMDSVDALEGTTVWPEVARMLLPTQNRILVVAGRNARAIGEALQSTTDDAISLIDLPPLPAEANAAYLQHKQQLTGTALQPHLVETILWLAGGKPLLLDLLMEWQTRGIAMDWLQSYQLAELQALADAAQHSTRQGFEEQLLSHVTELGEGMDWLILVMACVYPLDRETIGRLLGLPPDEASTLFENAGQYGFVKRLPNERIALHDEMRRMVNDYVWSVIDPEGDPQRRASRIASEYLEREILALTESISALQQASQPADAVASEQTALSGFMAREPLEQQLWTLKSQLLEHMLIIDVDEGVAMFAQLFDEATQVYRFSFRDPLLNSVQRYLDRLSNEQLYTFWIRQSRYFLDEGEYILTRDLVTDVLARDEIQPDQQVHMLIQRANAEIRLGNVEKGIADFEAAVAISEANQLVPLVIRTKNALGWAHRLVGEFDLAIRYYREAQALCLDEGALGDDYGWILNNLTFVLSRQNHRNAIGFGRSAVAYWRSLGNDIGLGAGYLVLGTVYYESGFYDEALEVLEKALKIFEPLQLQNWMAQIYAWRGAVYYERSDFARAEAELLGSLDIGTRNIEPITLNHLGHLYLAQERWKPAEVYFQRSYRRSQQIPDFVSWIGALAGLITLAAETHQYDQRASLERQVDNFLSRIKTPDGKLLGLSWCGLARLALGQRDSSSAIDLLERGITLVAAHDALLRTDLLSQLALAERELQQLEPDQIRQIGQALRERFRRQEVEDVVYGMVMPVIHRWARWEEPATD